MTAAGVPAGVSAGVSAVVSALDPGPGLVDAVREVLPQVRQVVVVDDGSTQGAEVFAQVRGLGAQVHHQPNAGVAAALSAGVAQVLRDEATALVLTLDQDSRPGPSYVERAVGAWREATAHGIPVAFVSAASYSGHPTPTDGWVRGFARAFDPMQSGLLIPAATFHAVGTFEAALVVDAVDSEFTIRCRSVGLVPVVGPGCDLEHGQGERLPVLVRGRAVRLAGRELGYNRHTPVRVYYMARNGTLLTRRYLAGQPRWVLRRLREEARAHLLRLAFSPDRRQLAGAVVAGWRDGVAGRTGRIDPALARSLERPLPRVSAPRSPR